METDIHYPTESSLIGDGMRKIIPLCVELAAEIGQPGWRQGKHLLKRVKEHMRTISQISASKSPRVKARLPKAYERLLDRVSPILDRAKTLQKQAENGSQSVHLYTLSEELKHWIELYW